MPFSYHEAAGDPLSADGIFIPVSALPGMSAEELADAEPVTTKESKTILSMLNALFIEVTAMTPLGMSATKGKASVNNDVDSLSFTFGIQYFSNLSTATISVLPLPTTGTNAGVGGLTIADVFPGATHRAAASNSPSAGVLIPDADIETYTNIATPSNPSIDNRMWFSGFLGYLAARASLRSPTVPSALTARARSKTNAFTLPPAATAATNPTTGINPNNLNRFSFFAHTFSFTLQILLNQTAQTFDVNAVAV